MTVWKSLFKDARKKSYVDKANVVLSVNDVWEAYLCDVDL